MPSAISLDSCSIYGAPSPLRVIRVEHLNELVAWKVATSAAVLIIALMGAGVGRAGPPEGLPLYLGASSASWLPRACVPFAGAAVQPTRTHHSFRHRSRSAHCLTI
jgi:hypothetical protein